jgi:hypothetical protein
LEQEIIRIIGVGLGELWRKLDKDGGKRMLIFWDTYASLGCISGKYGYPKKGLLRGFPGILIRWVLGGILRGLERL